MDMQGDSGFDIYPDVNYEFDNLLGGELENDDGCMVREGPSFCPDEFFTSDNGWNDVCREFFIKEHDARCGRAQIVTKCLLNGLVRCERIKQEDVWYPLYAVARFYKMSKSEKENMCTMIKEIRDKKDEEISILKLSIKNALTEELACHMSHCSCQPLLQE